MNERRTRIHQHLALGLVPVITLHAALASAAGPPSLVADLNTTASTAPHQYIAQTLAATDEGILFAASDPVQGLELWWSDGTPEGTHLVVDTIPAASSTNHLGHSAVSGDWLMWVFAKTVWRTSLITRETQWVASRPVAPAGDWYVSGGPRGGFLLQLVDSAGIGGDGRHRLWATGPPDWEMVPLADLPDHYSAPADVRTIAVVGDWAVLAASSGEHGVELWRTDGTPGGTALLADLRVGAASSGPRDFVASNGRAFFGARLEDGRMRLWQTDGTPHGTVVVSDVMTPDFSWSGDEERPHRTRVAHNGLLCLVAHSAAHGIELWVTDGTAVGTRLLRDIYPGPGDSQPAGLVSAANGLYFVARTPDAGRELWRTDGTTEGTTMVRDIVPGFDWSWPIELRPWKDGVALLAYVGDNDIVGRALWESDGTEAGTRLLEPRGFSGTHAGILRADSSGDRIFFVEAQEGESTSARLRVVSGLTGATTVRPFPPPASPSNPDLLVRAGDRIFFRALTSPPQLFVTDGTTPGTRQLTFDPAFMGLYPAELVATDTHALYLTASLTELWSAPASGSNPARVRAFGEGAQLSGLIGTAARAFFTVADASGHGIWSSNGTAAGTTRSALYPLTYEGTWTDPFAPFAVFGEEVVYAVRQFPDAPRLVFTDRTASRTIDLGTAKDRAANGVPILLSSSGHHLAFFAPTEAMGTELWWSDGTAEGTHVVCDIRPGPEGAASHEDVGIAWLGEVALFSANDGEHGKELWRSDGTAEGTFLVCDLEPGPASGLARTYSSTSPTFVVLHDAAYFSPASETYGDELWRTDGTSGGTRFVCDIWPGPPASHPRHLTVARDRLWFAATDGASGYELWTSDGSATGTRRVDDLAPGTLSSNPAWLRVLGDTLVFAADDASGTGMELWSIDPRAAAPAVSHFAVR